MPTYLITAPDGRKLKVNAPEGATEADAIAYAKANMPEASAPDKGVVSSTIGAGQAAAGGTVSTVGGLLRLGAERKEVLEARNLASPRLRNYLREREISGMGLRAQLPVPEELKDEYKAYQYRVSAAALQNKANQYGLELVHKGSEMIEQAKTKAPELLVDVASSVPTTAAALAASALTKNAGIGQTIAGLSQTGATYGGERTKGTSIEDATGKATFLGVTEAISEKLPIDTLLSTIKGGFFQKLLTKAGAEGLQESLVQAVEEGYDSGILDRETSIVDALKRVGYAGLVGVIAGTPTAAISANSEVKIDDAKVRLEQRERLRKQAEAAEKARLEAIRNTPPAELNPDELIAAEKAGREEAERYKKEYERRAAEEAKALTTPNEVVPSPKALTYVPDTEQAGPITVPPEGSPEQARTAREETQLQSEALKAQQQAEADAEYERMMAEAKARKAAKANQPPAPKDTLDASGKPQLGSKVAVVDDPQRLDYPAEEATDVPEGQEATNQQLDDLSKIDFADSDKYTGEGMEVSHAQKIVDYLKSKWTIKPETIVFNDFNQLDPDVRESVRKEAQARGQRNPAAFRIGNKIYLNASRLSNASDIQTAFSHEGLGHFGFELYHGEGKARDIWRGIARTRTNDVYQFARRYKLNWNDPAQREQAAAEYVAYLAQQNPKHSLVKYTIAKIRSLLRKAGLVKTLSDNDIIQNYILPAKKMMETGSKYKEFQGRTTESLKQDAADVGLEAGLAPSSELANRQKRLQDELRVRDQSTTDTRPQFMAADIQDYKNMDTDRLKRVYLELERRGGEQEDISKVHQELISRGINPNRFPKRPEYDPSDVDLTVDEANADEFSRQVIEATLERFRKWRTEDMRTKELSALAEDLRRKIQSVYDTRNPIAAKFRKDLEKEFNDMLNEFTARLHNGRTERENREDEGYSDDHGRVVETWEAMSDISLKRARDDIQARLNENPPEDERAELLASLGEANEVIAQREESRLRPTGRLQSVEGQTVTPADRLAANEDVTRRIENITKLTDYQLDVLRDDIVGNKTLEEKHYDKLNEEYTRRGTTFGEGYNKGPDSDPNKPNFQADHEKVISVLGHRYDGLMSFVRSSSDVLKKQGGIIGKLGQKIQDMVDYAQVNRGIMQKHLTPMTKRLEALPVDVRKQTLADFAEYAKQSQVDEKRAEAIYKTASPELKDVIDSVTAAFEAAGNKMEKLGIQVHNPVTGERHNFKKLKGFFPLMLKAEYRDALSNPMVKKNGVWDYRPEFKELAQILIDKGYIHEGKEIKTYEDAAAYGKKSTTALEFETGFFGNIERARTMPFPIELYDTSIAAVRKYQERWAERLAQIEAFGQEIPFKKKDLFGEVLDGLPPKDPRRQHIEGIRDVIYGDRRAHSMIERVAQTASTLATGLQISGIKSVIKNTLGGITNSMTFMDTANTLKAMRALLDSDTRDAAFALMNDLGVTMDDYLRVMADLEAQGLSNHAGYDKVNKAISDFTSMMMSLRSPLGAGIANKLGLHKISFNNSEMTVRVMTGLAAKFQLDSWMQEYATNPLSRKSKVFSKIVAEEGINMDNLLKEPGFEGLNLDSEASPETARLIRRMVNRAQGSYRQDQVPRWMDSPVGKFFFKYTKYGFQLGRMFDKQVIENLRSDDRDLRVEGVKNMLKYFTIYGGMSTLAAWFLRHLFGDDLIPDEEEFAKVMADKLDTPGVRDDVAYLVGTAARTINIMGAFGPLSIAYDKMKQWQDYGDSPMSAPGLAIGINLAKFMSKWTTTATTSNDPFEFSQFLHDSANFISNNISVARQGRQLLTNVFEGPEADYSRQVAARARKAIQRYEKSTDEVDLDSAAKNFSDIITGEGQEHRALYDSVANDLIKGDAKEAKRRYDEAFKRAKTKADAGKLQAGIKNSIMSRRPFAVHGTPGGTRGTALFMRWAETHMDKEDYAEMYELDRKYMKAAADAGLIDRKYLFKGTYLKAIREYEKGLRPAKK